MKYGFIREHRQRFPVARLCRLLAVSRSGFHAWLNRPVSARALADQGLLIAIWRVHLEHRQAYGGVKTWRTLSARGIACGKHRVARLRREAGIQARREQRQRIMIEHHKTAAPAPDLLVRRFTTPFPNRIWAGDMTFIRTREGWLHLAVLLDLFSRKVVGWAMDQRPGQLLHLGALRMALAQRCPEPGLIHHTDRGPQYTTQAYRALLEAHGVKASMNGRKVPQDNAVAESFFSNLKNELIHHRDFRSRNEARAAIFDYIELFYNRKRIHQSLGYRTPEQIEREWCGA
ncbi:MAG: IS3 family transposase [Burkholderiales bacterium]